MKLSVLSQDWMTQRLPSADALVRQADDLVSWKNKHHLEGLWPSRPQFFTATLDDGIGQGLKIIHAFADVLGLAVTHLGLTQSPEKITAACQQSCPHFLGLTVLQLDSEPDLAYIAEHLPQQTRLIAGGPVFKYDPDMAERCGVTYVADNAAYFIDYLLKWPASF